MELDELKASWQNLDRRLSRLGEINLALATDAQVRKARWRLLPVAMGALLNIAIGAWLFGVFARFWSSHLDVPGPLVAGIALHAGIIGFVIIEIVRLVIIAHINFAQPVVAMQRHLASLETWEARTFRWGWLAAWLLTPAVLVAGCMAIAGVDLWERAPGVVLINVAVAVSVALLSGVMFHRLAQRRGARAGVWLERLLTNHSVQRAKSALAEIDRFAHE